MKKLMLQSLVLIISLMIYSGVTAQDFKPSGTLTGYVFGDYYVKQHADSAGRGSKNVQYSPTMTPAAGLNTSAGSTGANAFQIRRAYLQYDYNLTQKISAHATLADEQDVDGSGYNTTYLKYMYVQYNDIFKGSNLFFGQMPTPSFAQTPTGTEPLWGYRCIERTILDMHNEDPSTDLGFALQGNLLKQKLANDTLRPNLLGYEVQIGNGNGAKPAVNIFRKFRGTVYASLLQQKLNFGIYMDYYRTALGTMTMNGTVLDQWAPMQATSTYKIYADYRTRIFKIGAEVFIVDNSGSDVLSVKNAEGINEISFVNGVQQGISVFLSGKIIKKLNYFARYDNYNPDTKFNSGEQKDYKSTYYGSIGSVAALKTNTSTYTQSFVTAGLDYTLTPRIHFMPNIWYNKYDSKLANVGSKVNSDYDLVYRLTFYVIFNSSKKVQNNGMDSDLAISK